MELNYFEIDGRSYYHAFAWDSFGDECYDHFFSTKKSAVSALISFIKNTDLRITDAYVLHIHDDGFCELVFEMR